MYIMFRQPYPAALWISGCLGSRAGLNVTECQESYTHRPLGLRVYRIPFNRYVHRQSCQKLNLHICRLIVCLTLRVNPNMRAAVNMFEKNKALRLYNNFLQLYTRLLISTLNILLGLQIEVLSPVIGRGAD
jgi:hypothetical protein